VKGKSCPRQAAFLFKVIATCAASRMNANKRLIYIAASATLLTLAGLIFTRNLIDFPVYYAAGQSLTSGRTDLYSPDFARSALMDYRYLPFFLIAFTPLWLLPYSIAAFTWYVLCTLEIAACVIVLRNSCDQLAKQRQQKGAKPVWIISLLATGQYFVMILHYGNAHLLAVSLLFGAFYLAMRRKSAIAALLMALAITIKLTPVLLLPYFALRKHWSFLSLTIALLVAINLAPAFYFGFSQNTELLKAWYEHVVVDQEFHEVNGPINLSLKGQLRRYLTEVNYGQRIDGDVEYKRVNLLALPTKQADRLWLVLALTLFASGLMLIWWRMRRDKLTDDGCLLELSLMICLMLIIGPLTSKIYFIALLWPVACLAQFAFTSNLPSAKRIKRALVLISIINFVLPLLPGRSIQRLFLVFGIDFYVTFFLLVLLVYALLSSRIEVPSGELRTRCLQAAKTP
jgi:hypothetical protein